MFETFWMGQERRIEGDRALPGQVGGAAHVFGDGINEEVAPQMVAASGTVTNETYTARR